MKKYGKIKWFSNVRGYGFILVDSDSKEKEEIFCHVSDLLFKGYPNQDDRVCFDIEPGARGVKAVEIERV